MEFVSVVIPAYNSGKTIGDCLDSIIGSGYPKGGYEIIVVNDGSDDNTAEIAKSKGVKLVNIAHKGRSSALNAGIKSAKGKIILFTDADCVVPRTWVKDHLNYYRKHKDLAGVGGLQLSEKDTFIDIFKRSMYADEVKNTFFLEGEYNGMALAGNNMSLKKSVLEDVNGFDKNFIMGADSDLTERLLEKGFRLAKVPDIKVVHMKKIDFPDFVRTSFRRSSGIVYLNMKNKRFSLLKSMISFFYIPVGRMLKHYGDFSHMAGKRIFKFPSFLMLYLISYYASRIGNMYYYLYFKFRR